MGASMKANENRMTSSPITRRTFLRNGAILTAGIAALSAGARAQTNKNSKLRIFQIGVGGIGGLERGQLKGYDKAEFVGFCDVDRVELDKVSAQYPGSFKLTDYREAFASKADQFDAVIVETPDFHHCPMMLTAMKHKKHIYGQKPLVHQLDELRLIKEGLKARPELVTQMGNQRACLPGRMKSVEILRSNQLGKPVAAYVWTGGVERGHYFAAPWSEYTPAKQVPETLDWNLWRGPLQTDIPYSDDIAPRRWRAYWETGGGQLADWGCHLLDLIYFAYDLPSPEAVQTHTIRAANSGHSFHNQSVITYPGGGKFARDKFVVHYNDSGLMPSFAALGLPPMKVDANHTMVVCEEGTLLLQADGKTTIFRKGKVVQNEPMPEVAPRDHWKDWVDNCHGAKKPLWTPFDIGVRITEPALLSVKATRYPGQELRWDGASHRFTNHDQANKEIVSRNYREGFEPPKVG
ncbi:MAG: Gfo/Idh/MocA family protein [Verrucomicrobiales bacterium]